MKKKLIVLQEEVSDCGACSLLSIIHYYGGSISLEKLRAYSLTTSYGVTAFNLIECAKKVGFEAKGLKEDNLNVIHLPAIVHLKINKSLSHFVVLYEVNKNNVILMDPACGKKVMSLLEFRKLYTGIVIELIPKSTIINENNKNEFKKVLINSFKKELRNIIFITVLLLFIIISTILNSLYINFLIKYKLSLFILLISFLIIFMKVILDFKVTDLKSKFNANISLELLPNFFNHILSLPLNYIHLKDSGEILKRFDEMEEIKNVYLEFFINLIINGLIIFVILILLIFINKWILFASIGWLFIYFIFVYLTNRNIKEKVDDVLLMQTNYQAIKEDKISGLTSIHHANTKEYTSSKLKESLEKYLLSNKRYEKYININYFIKNFYTLLFEFGINTYLVILFLHLSTPFTTFILVNSLIGVFISSVTSLMDMIPSLIYTKSIILRINDFYDLDHDDMSGFFFKNGNIKFKNVSFSYNNYNNTLNNISFNIKKGEKVLLQGISGKGKSTICRLINKEYLNYDGTISINNKNILDISTSSLRNHISYSSQKETIFSGTIKENILMGEKVSDDYFKLIYDICSLDKVIEYRPFKLDTYLYGGGDDLSGGERQLIILARTLIRNKDIIILDETLSEVNSNLEKKIVNDIFKYLSDKTIIYISHKNNLSCFDRIINV